MRIEEYSFPWWRVERIKEESDSRRLIMLKLFTIIKLKRGAQVRFKSGFSLSTSPFSPALHFFFLFFSFVFFEIRS